MLFFLKTVAWHDLTGDYSNLKMQVLEEEFNNLFPSHLLSSSY